MLWSSLIAGFTLVTAGSLHCIGMCGPLSLALPTWHLSKSKRFISLLLYQFGRIITYSLLGLIFGLAGRGFYIAGIQQLFSIILGILVLIAAILYFEERTGTVANRKRRNKLVNLRYRLVKNHSFRLLGKVGYVFNYIKFFGSA